MSAATGMFRPQEKARETPSASFVGTALPLTDAGVKAACDLIGVGPEELWTILSVETIGCGFLADYRPTILFERHVFHRRTGGKFDSTHPGISNAMAGGYGRTGEYQYMRLNEAVVLDRKAALESASWGIGQVMGFNSTLAGCADAETLVAQAMRSEDDQLMHMARFIVSQHLDSPLKNHDWATFAKGYNGAGYVKNKYDIRLRQRYTAWATGPLPDLGVRAMQVRLIRAGYDPGPIDGMMGRRTRAALEEYPAAA